MVGTADSVLIREMSLIQSVLYREVPLYSIVHERQVCHILSAVMFVSPTAAQLNVVNVIVPHQDVMYIYV